MLYDDNGKKCVHGLTEVTFQLVEEEEEEEEEDEPVRRQAAPRDAPSCVNGLRHTARKGPVRWAAAPYGLQLHACSPLPLWASGPAVASNRPPPPAGPACCHGVEVGHAPGGGAGGEAGPQKKHRCESLHNWQGGTSVLWCCPCQVAQV